MFFIIPEGPTILPDHHWVGVFPVPPDLMNWLPTLSSVVGSDSGSGFILV